MSKPNILLVNTNTTTNYIETDNYVTVPTVAHRACPNIIYSDGIGAVVNGPCSNHYVVAASVTATTPTVGNATIEIWKNGEIIPAALATETTSTASTEVITLNVVTSFYSSRGCVQDTIRIYVSGVGLDVTNASMEIFQI